MASDTEDGVDYSYTVDIGTVQLESLSETASPTFPGPSDPDLITGSSVSRAFPVSKDSPEIRVLDLQKSEHFNDPLVGTFRIVSLGQKSNPYFTALSYVWGSSHPMQGITIDLGIGLLFITRNCQDALKHIRHLYGDTTIWVDSICIDQSCDAERCHQVSLMGDVYSRADKVYIWLGQETPGIRRALEWIEFAASFMYLPLDRDTASGALQRLKFQLKVLPLVVTCRRIRNKWRLSALRRSYRSADLEELLGVAWFSRIWTFQEVVLAKDAVILCGTTTLNWYVFARGFRCLASLWTRDIGTNVEKLFLRKKASESDSQEDALEVDVSRVKIDRDRKLFADVSGPRGLVALQRVFFLWLRIDRQGLRCKHFFACGTADKSSILWHQRRYIGMWNRHLRKPGSRRTERAAFALLVGIIITSAPCPRGYGWLYLPILDGGLKKTYVLLGIFFAFVLFRAIIIRNEFNPEGYTEDLQIKRSKHQVNDQLMAAVVETLGYRQAKEPKDLSYALYGVLRGFGVDLAELDYSKPQARIYHELCLDMLKFRPSAINLLIYVNKVQRGQTSMEMQTEMSPTWVPD